MAETPFRSLAPGDKRDALVRIGGSSCSRRESTPPRTPWPTGGCSGSTTAAASLPGRPRPSRGRPDRARTRPGQGAGRSAENRRGCRHRRHPGASRPCQGRRGAGLDPGVRDEPHGPPSPVPAHEGPAGDVGPMTEDGRRFGFADGTRRVTSGGARRQAWKVCYAAGGSLHPPRLCRCLTPP